MWINTSIYTLDKVSTYSKKMKLKIYNYVIFFF